MNRPHVVVLGAGYAGTMAAARLAGRARVTVVNAAPWFVERVRLHQVAAAGRPRRHALAALLRGADLRVGRVAGIDVAAQRLRFDDGSAPLAWDLLVYAAGSGADHAPPAAHTVANEAGALRLAAALGGARSVAVCGGGLTAIETASEIAEMHRGLRVRLLASGPVGPSLSEPGRDFVRATLARLGVEVREGAAVTAVERGAVGLADGSAVEADVAVWCAGFAPPPLAREAGLPTAADGRLLVDASLRAPAAPHVFGAGDAALPPDAPHMRMACATAGPMAVQAAAAVLAAIEGRAPAPFGYAYVAQCLSLGRRAGLVQRVGPDDAPRPGVIRGRPAAWIKEAILRGTVLALRFPGLVPAGPRRAPALAAAEQGA